MLDKQLQRFLLLFMRQAVVTPETELIHAQLLVVLDPRKDLFGRTNHRRLVQALHLNSGRPATSLQDLAQESR